MPFSKNAIRIFGNFLGGLDEPWDDPKLKSGIPWQHWITVQGASQTCSLMFKWFMD